MSVGGQPADMDETSGRMAGWCAGEDWCPITSTATLVGREVVSDEPFRPVLADRPRRVPRTGHHRDALLGREYLEPADDRDAPLA